jgi:hypothetical protein
MRSGGLHAADWAVIDKYQRCLKPLQVATKRLEGRGKHHHSAFGAIHKVLPVFEYLLEQLEKLAKPYADVDFDAHHKAPEGQYYACLWAFLANVDAYRSHPYQRTRCLEEGQ